MKADSSNGKQLTIQTIFIADDDADDLLLFRQALHDIAPQVRLEATKDGEELLSLLQNFKPDLLFLDLDMPSKNGLQCLQAIRSNPIFADMAIIVFSSTTRPANIAVAYEMGADLYLTKPSYYQELLDAIKMVLELNWADSAAIQEMKLRNSPFFQPNDTNPLNIKRKFHNINLQFGSLTDKIPPFT